MQKGFPSQMVLSPARSIFQGLSRRRSPARFPPGPSFYSYELEKSRWIARHPAATPLQYERAMLEIAKRCGV